MKGILTILSLIGSACGILAAIDVLLKWRKQLKKNYQPQLSQENRESLTKAISTEPVEDAKSQIGERLYEMLDLMNQNRNIKINISELAEFCGYDKTEDLEKYFFGLEEPNNKVKEKICSDLGVNLQWLKHGKGEPFRSQEAYELYAEDYLETIINKCPQEIFFIRSKHEDGRACIVLRINEFKYLLLPSEWNISEHVGSTGQKQIYSFYKLIKGIQNLKSTNYQFQYITIVGNHIEQADFNNLICGKIYPESAIKFYNDNWWDDLTDINHAWHYAPSYKKEYGSSFIEAQEIIKDFENMNGKNN